MFKVTAAASKHGTVQRYHCSVTSLIIHCLKPGTMFQTTQYYVHQTQTVRGKMKVRQPAVSV